jgi:pimeloyl-ACP methyl ester carboxylesterase
VTRRAMNAHPNLRRLVVGLSAFLALGCHDHTTAPVPLGFGLETVYSNRREVEVGFQSADGAVLSGTLILPLAHAVYPTIVMHFGSNRWTRATYDGSHLAFWIDNGIAVLTYDKRGVGRSQGTCCPWHDPTYFPLLAQDVIAAVRVTKTHPEVDPSLVGGWGFSQGGWIVPLAAATAPGEITWMIIGSGPAVSVGEEELYSQLTGDDKCTPTGLSESEIEAKLDSAGPSGYDPRPILAGLATPGLWIYGGLDTSVPVARSVAVLEGFRAQGRDYTTIVLPRLNHEWILDGAMCQTTGPGGVDGSLISSWLWPYLGRPLPTPHP